MTQTVPYNNGSTSSISKNDQSVVESSNKVSVSAETLTESFKSVDPSADLFEQELTLVMEASKQILPNGETMSLDAYRRLYNLKFEKELPPYPKEWIWQNPTGWTDWIKSLCMEKHVRPLVSKGAVLMAKWGAIGTTVVSVSWASVHYVMTIPERQQQAHNQAWQVINSAKGLAVNGGRVDALQALVKDKVSLAKLDAPNAYLAVNYDRKKDIYQGIKLPDADLWGANLSESILSRADLKKAILDSAKLQRANLVGATLNESSLISADLRLADLRRATLPGAHLQNATLISANLANTDLRGADLTNTDLRGADLKGADLTGAKLNNIIYDDQTVLPDNEKQELETNKELNAVKIAPNAVLKRAYLRGADLTGANLVGANLTGANLMDADLREANLTGATLTGAIYNLNTQLPKNLVNEFQSKALKLSPNANLNGANLESADLRFVDLKNANLTNADLSSAALTRANLTSANLTGANLTNANLRGVDLSSTQLAGAQLRGAQYDQQTVFPKGFDLVGAQMQVKTEE